MRRSILWVLCLIVPCSAYPQDLDQFGIWTAAFLTVQPSPDTPMVAGWLDVHLRRDPIGTTAILRPAVGLRYASWGSVWAGYGFVPVWTNFATDPVVEHRLFEQAIFGGQPGRLLLQARTRLEQRWRVGENSTAHRFRQFARLNVRFEGTRVGIALWDELFLGIADGGWAKTGFDQNRTFVGLALRDAERPFRMEIGYLAVFVQRTESLLTHNLSINLFWSPEGR